jgi:hypothetical protein
MKSKDLEQTVKLERKKAKKEKQQQKKKLAKLDSNLESGWNDDDETAIPEVKTSNIFSTLRSSSENMSRQNLEDDIKNEPKESSEKDSSKSTECSQVKIQKLDGWLCDLSDETYKCNM